MLDLNFDDLSDIFRQLKDDPAEKEGLSERFALIIQRMKAEVAKINLILSNNEIDAENMGQEKRELQRSLEEKEREISGAILNQQSRQIESAQLIIENERNAQEIIELQATIRRVEEKNASMRNSFEQTVTDSDPQAVYGNYQSIWRQEHRETQAQLSKELVNSEDLRREICKLKQQCSKLQIEKETAEKLLTKLRSEHNVTFTKLEQAVEFCQLHHEKNQQRTFETNKDVSR